MDDFICPGCSATLTQRHPLRAYDAIQLSSALYANDFLRSQDLSFVFISGDGRLIEAARAEGLAADNPFDHTEPGEARS